MIITIRLSLTLTISITNIILYIINIIFIMTVMLSVISSLNHYVIIHLIYLTTNTYSLCMNTIHVYALFVYKQS